MKDTTIIIPTYNEAENLPELVRRIHASVDSSVGILIMDDSPGNGTANAARMLGCGIVQRYGPKGLSKAVIDGIRLSESDKIIVMDADLQHPPELIPKLVEQLDTNDFVVASRYIEGGSCEEWDIDRRFISKTANLITRPLTPVKDAVSGFFGFKRSGLPELECVNDKGFKIMLELLVKGNWSSVVEVPYTFAPRKRGQTKLRFEQIRDYATQLVSLYLHKFRWLRFGMVGAVGAVIAFPLLYTLTEYVGLFYILSAVIAIVCASTNNYFLNNLWTFREKRRRGRGHIVGWLNYQMLSATGDGLYLGLLVLFTEIVGLWYMLSAVVSIGIVFVFKFTFASRVIWRRNKSQ